jgi:putative oxidoreductase
MSAVAKLDRPVLTSLRVLAALSFLAPLATRFLIGHAFYLTGKGKLAHPPVEFFEKLGIPLPHATAVFIANLEYWGGMLVIVGLLTRLTAFLLSSTMLVALMTAHREELKELLQGVGEAVPTDITVLVYLVLLLWLIFFGPGLVSLDALLFRRWRTRVVSGTEPAKE